MRGLEVTKRGTSFAVLKNFMEIKLWDPIRAAAGRPRGSKVPTRRNADRHAPVKGDSQVLTGMYQ